MSSKKNRNRKKNPAVHGAPHKAAEKLVQQLNKNEDPDSSDREDILAEYERKAELAEKRMEERRRRAAEEAGEGSAAGGEKKGSPDAGGEKAPEEKKDVQYEAAQAEQRMAERLRRSEELLKGENAGEAERNEPKPETKPEPEPEENDSDVKRFVPRSGENREEPSESLSDALSEDLADISAPEPSDNAEGGDGEDAESEGGGSDAAAVQRPNRFYLVFAVFVIIMSVIGVISTVRFCAGVVSDIANQTELKNEIALFLYPVVTVDPPDCDSVDELPETIIVESAIWRIILTGDKSNYEKLYNTYMYVPAIDVEYSVRSIFGNSVDIVHQTVGTMDITFNYVAESNSYLVPIDPHYTAYSPRITEISNVGELYTVTVEYIPPSALSVEGIDFEVTPAKTIVYTMSKSKNSATIHSIKNITRLGSSYEY